MEPKCKEGRNPYLYRIQQNKNKGAETIQCNKYFDIVPCTNRQQMLFLAVNRITEEDTNLD